MNNEAHPSSFEPVHPPPTTRTALRLPRLLAVALFAACVAGCGGSDESRAASDTSKPLEGRDVTKASSLTGTWMRVSPGPILGFEFLKDGKVLATLGSLDGTVTLGYSLLDGGRLSLVAPGGATTIFGTTLGEDLLELRRESGSLGATAQRFRRVASGTTLAAAIQAHAAELQAGRESRLAALRDLLSADDLVIAKAGETGPAAVLALRVESVHPQLTGTLVMDDDPASEDLLRPVRIHPFSGSIQPMDDVTDRLRILVNVQPAITPPGQQGSSGRLELMADGPIDQSTVKGAAQFPQSWIGEAEVALARQRGRHADATAKLEKQAQARREAIARVTDALGGRAELSGRKTTPTGEQDLAVTLERIEGTDTYEGTAALGAQDELVARGAVEAVLGKGVLFLDLPNGEQWRVELDNSGGALSGRWRPNTRADFIGHGEVLLDLDHIWSAAEVAAEREAIRQFLTVQMRTPTPFIGHIESRRGGDTERWPVWAELQVAADNAVSGSVWLVGQGVGVAVSGRLAGDTLQFTSSGTLPDSANTRSFATQRWQVSLKRIDPHPRLTGSMSSTMGGGGSVHLVPVANTDIAQARESLAAAVDGRTFVVVNTTISRKPEPSYFRFQIDRATGAVSGDVVGEDLTGSRPSALPPGLITGSVVEERGHAVLRLVVEGSPEPVRARPGERFEFTLTTLTGKDGVVFTGWDPPGRGNQTWLQLTPAANDATIAVSAEQQLRLAAQRMGAGVAAPEKPAVGDRALVLVHATERHARVGQIFTADGRYSHGNSLATAALHAGLMKPGETAVLRVTYQRPFTEPTLPVEQHGVTSQRGTFRPNNTIPTFTLERVDAE